MASGDIRAHRQEERVQALRDALNAVDKAYYRELGKRPWFWQRHKLAVFNAKVDFGFELMKPLAQLLDKADKE